MQNLSSECFHVTTYFNSESLTLTEIYKIAETTYLRFEFPALRWKIKTD